MEGLKSLIVVMVIILLACVLGWMTSDHLEVILIASLIVFVLGCLFLTFLVWAAKQLMGVIVGWFLGRL